MTLRANIVFAIVAVAVAGCNASPAVTPPASETAAQSGYVPQWKAQHVARAACPDARPGEAQCAVLVGIGKARPGVAGWAPADIAAAYRLPSAKKGKHQIVAVIDAYDNPNAASDLAVYRSNFGLPPADFHKFNQKGQQKNYPKADQGWGIEITIDVDMVSAACPNCTIYLIEANNNSLNSLGAAIERAVKLGARIVSNSWGCYQAGCQWHTTVFDDPAATYLAASGDIGYGSFPPAEFSNVISIGGTVLSKSGSTYGERVWPDSSGGCATGIAKPSWQHDPGCGRGARATTSPRFRSTLPRTIRTGTADGSRRTARASRRRSSRARSRSRAVPRASPVARSSGSSPRNGWRKTCTRLPTVPSVGVRRA